MAKFKPFLRVRTRFSASEVHTFDTYRDLRKQIKRFLHESYDDKVSVSRTRRGEWGEWFENWELVNGKPEIVKQGWM